MIGQRSTHTLDFYRLPRLAEIICGDEHDGDEIIVTLTLVCTNYYSGCREDRWGACGHPHPAEPVDAELDIARIEARLWSADGSGSLVALTDAELAEVHRQFDRAHAAAVDAFLEDAVIWRSAA